MIKFTDAGEKTILPELPTSLGFQTIRPIDIHSTEVALGFWNSYFEKQTSKETVKIDEQQILNEIYGRSETEFSFDFEIDDTLRSLLDRFQVEQWAEQSEEQKVVAVLEFSSILAQKMEISSPPKIEFYDGGEGDCGSYNPGTNTISFNRKYLHDPKETINTMAHEMRHAYQCERAEMQETYTDFLYLYNLNHYITPTLHNGHYINFQEYYGQYIEAEARAFANLFSKEVSK